MDKLREKMDSSVRAVNASVLDAASTVKEAASSVKDVAQQVTHAQSSNEIVNKVKGVFDLDVLAGVPHNVPAKAGTRFPKQDIVYVTQRIIIMGYPEVPPAGRSIASVAQLLNQRHGSNYMIYNLSEKEYDTSPFQGQVLNFKFPGYPAPPLKMLFELCISIESWLASEPENIVVIHCMTGRGRSAVVASCLLEWIGRASDAREALVYVCKMRRVQIKESMVPTQLRYLSMFHSVLQGERPRYQSLVVKRATLTQVPDMLSNKDPSKASTPTGGCRPYLQIYKNGKCQFTTATEDADREEGTRLVACGEGSSLELDIKSNLVDGDILLRVRHVDGATGKGTSMFRYGFHSGYLPTEGTLKLGPNDLDGASVDRRFKPDFSFELELGLPETDDLSAGDDMFDAALSAQSQDSFWDKVAEKKRIAEERSPEEAQKLLDSAASIAQVTAPSPKEDAAQESPDQSTVPEFSILDDDEETQTETRSKSVSDMELFDALNALETDGNLGLESPTSEAPPAPPAPATAPELVKAMAPAASATATPKVNKDASGDLNDLEEIERELLGGAEEKGTALKQPSAVESGAKAFTSDDDDPDLAELERYLDDM